MATNTLLRHFIPRHHHHHRKIITTLTTRPLSTTTTTESTKPHYWSNPGAFVSGVTTSDLENNPSIAAFFEANFSDYSLYQPKPKKEIIVDESKKKLNALNIRRLQCHLRDPEDETGKYANAELQDNRMVPGVIYGNERRKMAGLPKSERIFVKTEFKLLQRETDLYHHGFTGRVYELTVLGEDGAPSSDPAMVVPSDVNMHPVKNMFHCVNYLRYYPGRPVSIPIRYVNEDESPTLKRGGYIIPLKRKIPVVIEEGVPIPEFIGLECTGARNKDVLKLDRLIIPEGVTISKRVDRSTFLIGTVRGKREEGIEGNQSADK